MRPLAALMATLLILELTGCAHRAPAPITTPEPKPDPGAVGLAIAQQSPDATIQRPGTVGARHGAKEGAKTGALAPLVPGFVVVKEVGGDLRALLVGLMLLGAGVVLAPLGAGVGAAVGALTAPSQDKVEGSAEAIQRAFADANFPDALTYWIIEAGGQRPIVPIADPGSPATDTWLELDTPWVSLTSKDPKDWRPDLRLRVTVHGKLLRASDGEELGAWLWEHEGPKATFLQWGENDARMFRAELERAGRALAAQVIRDVY
jgi:hypothetical protein